MPGRVVQGQVLQGPIQGQPLAGQLHQGQPLQGQQIQYVTATPTTVAVAQPLPPSTTGTSTSNSNVTVTAANKAGAYGGSEVGALIGGAVGPPVIGGIVGNIVGERLGEKAVGETGLDKKVGRARDKLGNVIGNDNVDKLGEITLVALGYADDETCLCCPCIARSQIMLIIMFTFSIFIWYRLGLGVSWEKGCSTTSGGNSTGFGLKYVANDEASSDDSYSNYNVVSATNTTTLLMTYPCEYGFHYMVAGAAVWAFFLPFHIFTLLGNCWRQCCCCLCDPLVCCATICDLLKRYLCECGRFSVIALVWYSMCIFQIVWACTGLYWLVDTYFFSGNDENFQEFLDNVPSFVTFLKVTLASIILDLFIAGSELVHKFKAYCKNQDQTENQQQQQQQKGSYEMHERQQLA